MLNAGMLSAASTNKVASRGALRGRAMNVSHHQHYDERHPSRRLSGATNRLTIVRMLMPVKAILQDAASLCDVGLAARCNGRSRAHCLSPLRRDQSRAAYTIA